MSENLPAHFDIKAPQLRFLPPQKLAVEYLKKIAHSESKLAKHLKYPALFNIGRSYFQGFGVKQSDDEALR